MPEINLPTSAKQDSIKETVESINSNFPLNISGGTDWEGRDILAVNSNLSVSKVSAVDILNITGKGLIHGFVLNGNGLVINIVADGKDVVFEAPLSNSQLGVIIPFKRSIIISAKNKSQNNYSISSVIFYSLG